MGIPPHVILDYTFRELDAYARGVDMARRSRMATMLWAQHAGAGFFAYAMAGKRLPNIDRRLRQIMDPRGGDGRRSEVAAVIERMNAIAIRAGLPPPRKRGPVNGSGG